MKQILESIVITHEGNIRKSNQDNFNLFGQIKENAEEKRVVYKKKMIIGSGIAAIYDGMGGEVAGEIASYLAAKNITWHGIEELKTLGEEEIKEVNMLICNEAKKRNARCVGTTYTGLFFEDNWVKCCNIGDSRCYLLRNNQLYLLSKDHTAGQQLIDEKKISESDARTSKVWHQLTQNLGLLPEICPLKPNYSSTLEILEGDRFLLCSDGLSDMVNDRELQRIIAEKRSLSKRSKELLDEALKNGGRDNITFILIDIKKGFW